MFARSVQKKEGEITVTLYLPFSFSIDLKLSFISCLCASPCLSLSFCFSVSTFSSLLNLPEGCFCFCSGLVDLTA
jgi:hypothetical protein